MERDAKELVPEFEEIAAVSCAVQNMWLSCWAYGIGAYWSSPFSIIQAREFLDLKQGQRCLGLFYMGNFDKDRYDLKSKRASLGSVVEWIED